MSTRNAVLAAALTLTTFGFATGPAQAQTYYYGVHSTSQTLGYTGTYTDDSQLQPGGLFADTLSDPQGATMSAPGYATLYADTAAGTRLSVDAKLRVMAKTFFRINLSGDIQADATARLVIREIPEGVTLAADSGVVYPIVPAN